MNKLKYTTNDFIDRAIKMHGHKYLYDQVKYIGMAKKVKIGCKRCGNYFWQRAEAHLRGQGCSHCNMIKSQKDFIKKAKEIHGNKYDYSEVIYDGCQKPVKIWCKKCQKYFWQKPICHLDKAGCQICGIIKSQVARRSNKEEFIKKANKKYGDLYNYDKVIYINSRTKIKIHCNACNKDFEKTPSEFLSGHDCIYCKISKGEKQIKEFLERNKIKFEFQKRFLDCIDKVSLPFDFYLPEYKICIEFQGEQHYKPQFHINIHKNTDLGIKAFNEQLKHDKIKKRYCKKRKFKLLEIKYNKDIEKILEKELNIETKGKI